MPANACFKYTTFGKNFDQLLNELTDIVAQR
jgi:hypothetical protein